MAEPRINGLLLSSFKVSSLCWLEDYLFPPRGKELSKVFLLNFYGEGSWGMNVFHVDGWLLNSNPSDEGGWTIFKDGRFLRSVRKKGEHITNNQVELLGIIDALIEAEDGDEIISDSQLSVGFTVDGFKSKKNVLGLLAEIAQRLYKQKSVKVYWSSRDENQAGQYNDENYKQAGGTKQSPLTL